MTVAGEVWFVPTMFFSKVHSYGPTSAELVWRAMEAWVQSGAPSFYLYKDAA